VARPAGVARWVTDETERRWIEHALLVLLGLEGSAGAAREELFSAWRTFFERIAATGPVVLVFEDLHWADAGLLDFIDHVLDWSTGVPLTVVTLARPETLAPAVKGFFYPVEKPVEAPVSPGMPPVTAREEREEITSGR